MENHLGLPMAEEDAGCLPAKRYDDRAVHRPVLSTGLPRLMTEFAMIVVSSMYHEQALTDVTRQQRGGQT